MRTTAWQLVERGTTRPVVPRLEVADRFWGRLRGWQFRACPPRGSGLLLVPCSSVHTAWMRFAIDVVALGPRGEVLDVRRGVRPWRLVLPMAHARAILELPAGEAAGLEPGRALGLGHNGNSIPPSLRFLCD
jgi:uncharacterized protein